MLEIKNTITETMPLMSSLVEWISLKKESLSLRLCRNKLSKLKREQRRGKKNKKNRISKDYGTTIKGNILMEIPEGEKGKEKKKYLK